MLLAIIYLTFISLGLPDSALGSAWPSMYGELGAGVSWQGVISAIICCGTIVSSVFSTQIVRRLGTGRTSAFSVALTAIALMGFSSCTEFWQLCLWAIPYGLGAGAIDAALNSYAAIHFAARHMSWLHCMWGVGASAGPMIMSWRLSDGTWRDGFSTIGFIQVAITVVLFASLSLWKRNVVMEGPEKAGSAKGGHSADAAGTPQPAPSRRELLAMPGVRQILVCFFCYCALESTCGAWAASYCTLARGIDAGTAASWASLFFVGITIGRLVSGFATLRLSDKQLIRVGQAIIACGLLLVALPLDNVFAMMGLVVCGVGCAPIYPSILHCTPYYFGREFALALTGLQMAFAYVGSLVMSPLFGVLAQFASPALYPVYLGVLLVVMFAMAEGTNRAVGA